MSGPHTEGGLTVVALADVRQLILSEAAAVVLAAPTRAAAIRALTERGAADPVPDGRVRPCPMCVAGELERCVEPTGADRAESHPERLAG